MHLFQNRPTELSASTIWSTQWPTETRHCLSWLRASLSLTEWLSCILTHWHTASHVVLITGVPSCLMTEPHSEWLYHCLSACPTHWQNSRLSDWLTDRQTISMPVPNPGPIVKSCISAITRPVKQHSLSFYFQRRCFCKAKFWDLSSSVWSTS